MPRVRRCLFFLIAAVAFVIAAGAGLRSPRTSISRENAALIRVGMTLTEVEALLGGPPRDETDGNGWSFYNGLNVPWVIRDENVHVEWIGHDWCVQIALNEDHVVGVQFAATLTRQPTLWQRFFGWLCEIARP